LTRILGVDIMNLESIVKHSTLTNFQKESIPYCN